MRLVALLLALFVAGYPAYAVPLDPDQQIRPRLLVQALAALGDHPEATQSARLVVVDYGLHSADPRLFVVNLETGEVEAFRTTHGKGSDADHDGYLDSFSDEPGSGASPEGAYLVAEEYVGNHGRSLRLDGLDPTNANARERAIVIHAAAYAEPGYIDHYGKLGRSNGCIAFSETDLATFLADVPRGTLIYVGK